MRGRFHHVGLVVADLDRSVAFYRDRLGLSLLATGAESDLRYAEMLGLPRVRFAWAELDLGDGHVLELLRFDEPTDLAPPSEREPSPDIRQSRGAHIGIRVDDVDAVHRELMRDGVDVVSRPIELVEENQWLGVRVFYAFDPDGHQVELIEEPVTGKTAQS